MQRYATRASVVTSVGKIKLWQNEVTGNEWWIWPKVRGRGRVLGCGQTLVHFFYFILKVVLVLLMPTVTVASNLIFPPPKIGWQSWGLFFFFLPGFSLTSLKEQAMFPRAQLFEAHSFGHPEFFCSNSGRSDTVPTYISTMAGSWGPDHSRPTFCPQLSCLWQDRCMLCVLVLAANQGNPTVSPWWMLSTLPRPLCIPSMPVNRGALQYSRFRRCANHLKYRTVTQIPLLVQRTNPWNGSSVLHLWGFPWLTTNKTNPDNMCPT